MNPLHVNNAPSPKLVFSYLLGGLASFLFLGVWSLLHYAEWDGFYAKPHFLAWVHIAVLGWINLTIFGVLFQFIPVVLNVRLASEKLAWWQLVFYVPGAIGMVACFWSSRLDWPLHSFASVLWVGFVLFAWNMLVTYRQVKAWTWTARYIYAAILYLLATIMLGLFLSIHLAYPLLPVSHLIFLKLHAHVGFVGWFLFIVMGVGLKLLPMFLLAHDYTEKPAAWGFGLLNFGLLTWALATGFQCFDVAGHVGVWLMAAGVVACLVQVVAIYQKRNRVRSTPARHREVRAIEVPLRFAAGGFGVLGLAVAAGVFLVWGKGAISPEFQSRLVLIYGGLIFLGFLGLLIQAFLYKIMPFLVWLHRLGPKVGQFRVPNIRDLVPEGSTVLQLALYCAGAATTLVALGVAHPGVMVAGAAMMAAGSVWLTANLVVVWRRAVPSGTRTSNPVCEDPAVTLESAQTGVK